MSGKNAGVQALIRQKQPKAWCTHCAGHSLNLVIATSCGVPIIRNCIDSVKAMTLWVKASPKRERLLRAIYQKGVQEGITSSRAPLLNVCMTRWVENIDGWERFTLCHPFLVHMCEVILYGDDNFETYNDGWIADDKRNALAYLKILESFDFIYALVTLQRSLMYLKEAVVKLQGEDQDLVSGVLLVEQASDALQAL